MNNSSNILHKFGLGDDKLVEIPPKRVEKIFISATSEGYGFANNMEYIKSIIDKSVLYIVSDGFIYDREIFGVNTDNVFYNPKFNFWWAWNHIWQNKNGDVPFFLSWHLGDIKKLINPNKKREVKFISLNHNFKKGRDIFIENLSDKFIEDNWVSGHFSDRINLKNDKYDEKTKDFAKNNKFYNIIFEKLKNKGYIQPFFESNGINDSQTDKHISITEKSLIPFLLGNIAMPLSSKFLVSEYEKLGLEFVKDINGVSINQTFEWNIDKDWEKKNHDESTEVKWLKQQISKIEVINQENSLEDIENVYLKNIDIIEHNQNIVKSLMTDEQSVNELKQWVQK